MKEGVKPFFSSVIKATFLTVIVSLIGVLLFALLVKFADVPDIAIKIVNQFIKVVAVFCGCYFSLSGDKGLFKGITTGLISTLMLYLIFSRLSGAEVFGVKTLIDLIFVAVIGGISGIIAVNLRGKE